MIVSAIMPEHVRLVWPDIAPMLQKAIDTYPYAFNIGHVLDDVLSGKMQLWIAADEDEIVAAFATRVIPHPKMTTLAIQLVGGTRMKEWISEALRVFCNFAEETGCNTLEGYGRDAWYRVLKRHGFRKAYVVYEKELADGR